MAAPGQTGDGGVPVNIRTDIPHPARVYDYWLGGKDNFAADRAAAEQVLQFMPEIVDTVRGNRQFLDIGSGLPSSPNMHEVVQAGGTDARVVYTDHDQVVVSHAQALMTKTNEDSVSVVHADLRDVDKILSGAAALLDLTQPVALIFAGVLHHIPDSDDPAGVVARYLAALAPGSYLVISHATDEPSPEKMAANAQVADNSGTVLIPRDRDAILRMFNGRELVDPGLVLVSYWRPEGGEPGPNADRAWVYGGVAAV